jgi:ABC-type histidine transport system ATPase subunit
MSPAIELTEVSKRFSHEVKALDAVRARIACGERVALIGASGSGKSTLLRCISGLERIDAGGTIRLFGRVLQHEGRLAPDIRAQRRQLGVVFQQFNLVGRLPLITNVLAGVAPSLPLWRATLGRFTSHEQARALDVLDSVGLSAQAFQRASTLSGGQQQRAAIARALAMRPAAMLFDEPTSSLDPELVGEVLRVIRALAEEGRTMLLVTHELGFAREVASRAVFLHRGTIEEDGPPAQVFGAPKSERCRQFIASQLK